MSTRDRTSRALVATSLAVVLTALSVAVPLLDQGRSGNVARLTEAGAPAGYVDHHHAVCLQYGAAAWSPADGADVPSERFIDEAEPVVDTTHRSGWAVRSLHQSRAPPAA